MSDEHAIHTASPHASVTVPTRSRPIRRPVLVPQPLDVAIGTGIWVLATVAIMVVGNRVLPDVDAGFPTLVAYLIVCAATLSGTYAIAGVRARLGRTALNAITGLRLGAVILVIGLFLDGVLLAATGFSYPNVDAGPTKTIAVAFLLAYPLAVVGPWLAGLRAERTRPA